MDYEIVSFLVHSPWVNKELCFALATVKKLRYPPTPIGNTFSLTVFNRANKALLVYKRVHLVQFIKCIVLTCAFV